MLDSLQRGNIKSAIRKAARVAWRATDGRQAGRPSFHPSCPPRRKAGRVVGATGYLGLPELASPRGHTHMRKI